MAEAYQFDDPVSLAFEYLSEYYPGKIAREEPEPYDAERLLIIIKDGGGNGVYAHQLTDVRLTFEVRSGDQREAARVASEVDALIRDWSYRKPGVYFRDQLTRPQYMPEPDRRIPAYIWTAVLAFRGHQLNL
ncbi:hypothetical protein ACIP5Z_01695 [Rothia terrae]|uniref:hypothetical protein n=1 Tax=Rothia terrae TaxID=396015 RepID=UPI00381EFF62